jgi:putative glutamine amidotransferase
MSPAPRIAVILDEDTSTGGTRYDMTKGYFAAVARAGGLPFGIPYVPGIVGPVVEEFDGLLSVGGRFAFPDAWYVDDRASPYPASERLDIERSIMEGYLDRHKPVLGICSGMQMLACLNGCRLTPEVRALGPDILEHDKRERLHGVSIVPGTALSRIVGRPDLTVNSSHREAVIELSAEVVASARAKDGVIEAIEVPSRSFAFGLQWHQEAFAQSDHPGNRIFDAFVQACGRRNS